MSTQIKRLYQNSTEFVPITLAEAVVVNTNNTALPQLGITTLDKALQGIVGQTSTKLNEIVSAMNAELAKKQNTITWGEGFEISQDGTVNIVVKSQYDLYKIVASLPTASKECLNSIYLVYDTETAGNHFKEYVCIYAEKINEYSWEQIGSVATTVDLSGYVTQTQFNTKIDEINTTLDSINTALASSVTASNVTTSAGVAVLVSYEIPNTLYDN